MTSAAELVPVPAVVSAVELALVPAAVSYTEGVTVPAAGTAARIVIAVGIVIAASEHHYSDATDDGNQN